MTLLPFHRAQDVLHGEAFEVPWLARRPLRLPLRGFERVKYSFLVLPKERHAPMYSLERESSPQLEDSKGPSHELKRYCAAGEG